MRMALAPGEDAVGAELFDDLGTADLGTLANRTSHRSYRTNVFLGNGAKCAAVVSQDDERMEQQLPRGAFSAFYRRPLSSSDLDRTVGFCSAGRGILMLAQREH